MSDARKDFCNRCGWNKDIVHVGQVKRKPPFRGFDPVKYCKECFDAIASGVAEDVPTEVPLPPRDPEAVAIALGDKSKPQDHADTVARELVATVKAKKVPKADPASEVYLLKLRAKMGWFATGLMTGIGIAAAFFSLLYIQGALHP